ncbi:MAG: flagellar basal-body rod protein FlgF [Alphaproteobacteria bacterium]|nr:flagellar basal-body rod protein FlgF [Alphaproteobacteria bacterium]
MDNGIYVALSRQMGLFRDMDVTANNIANANTVGFGGEKVMFDDFLVKTSPDGGPRTAFTNDFASYRNLAEGPMKVTSNPLDVAISGPGYFAVMTPLGERYTRAGNFQLDTDGTLVTPEGYQVLDEGGQPIQFEPQDKEIAIGQAGDIVVDGAPRGNLGVFEFANPQLMERTGSTLYKADGLAQPAAASRVLHGTLEGSNISPVMELTHMIKVQRGVGSTAKLIDAQYELTRKTADTWAKSQS